MASGKAGTKRILPVLHNWRVSDQGAESTHSASYPKKNGRTRTEDGFPREGAWSVNGVKGQYAGCVSARAALDGVTWKTLFSGKEACFLSCLPGEGGHRSRGEAPCASLSSAQTHSKIRVLKLRQWHMSKCKGTTIGNCQKRWVLKT